MGRGDGAVEGVPPRDSRPLRRLGLTPERVTCSGCTCHSRAFRSYSLDAMMGGGWNQCVVTPKQQGIGRGT